MLAKVAGAFVIALVLVSQTNALSCWSCHNNLGTNCVNPKRGERIECSDPTPAQDTNGFLSGYFNISTAITSPKYTCINVYANYTNGKQFAYAGCAFFNYSMMCDELHANPMLNTSFNKTADTKNGQLRENFACKVCSTEQCNTSGAANFVAQLMLLITAVFAVKYFA